MKNISINIKELNKITFKNERFLSEKEVQIARFLGIKSFVRIKIVEISKDEFRSMLNEEANDLLRKLNLVKDKTNAITFGNRIFVFKSDDMRKTIAHELVHVSQYEMFGVEGFVQEYLNESKTTIDKKKIPLEIPAYRFGEDFKNNNYSVEGLNAEKYVLM